MCKTLKQSFGERLKEIRKSRGMTQEKLAEKLDIAPRQLTRLERGVNFPSVETLAKISLYLEVDLKSLFNFQWDREYTLCATGTDEKPVLEINEKDKIVDLSSFTKKKKNNSSYDLKQLINVQNSDESMLKSAKNINRPFTIIFKNGDGELSHVKTYYPDGKIEEILSKEKVETERIYNKLIKDIEKISDDMNKLQFINLAYKSLTDKNSISELKSMIKGIEIVLDSK